MSPAAAIGDLQELAALAAGPAALGMELRPGDPVSSALHLRLYRRNEPVAMSDILPLLENFDLRILNERPYRVSPTDGSTLWLQDIEVKHAGGRILDPKQEGRRFEKRSSLRITARPKATASIASCSPPVSTGARP